MAYAERMAQAARSRGGSVNCAERLHDPAPELGHCEECGEAGETQSHHTVDYAGDRTRDLCSDCAFACVDCGEEHGHVQRDDEHIGWVVCGACDQVRDGQLRASA